MSNEPQNDNYKFTRIFWFICGSVFAVMIYVFAVTFLQIPEGNRGMVNIILGVLLGNIIGGGLGYLLTGNPEPKKPSGTATGITSSITATTTKVTDQEPITNT